MKVNITDQVVMVSGVGGSIIIMTATGSGKGDAMSSD
jgi:hypothetical protein